MTDALTATNPAPQTDALAPQNDLPPAIDSRPAEEPKTEVKPEVKKNPDQSRSDAVKNAIDKALKPEEPKPEAKVEPKAEAKPAKDRAPDGKFAPVAPAVVEPKPEPKPTAFRDPPSRFDDAAKGEWENVPEGTRGAVHRTVRELEQGIAKHREAAEAFEPIRKYHDMAKQSGTDLPTALNRYVGMEQQLRQNPIAGLQAVVANLGLKGPNGQPVTLRDIAAHVLGQKPEQMASQQDATIQQLRQQLMQVQQQIGGVTQHVQAQQQEARTASVQSEWEGFKASNPNAATLEPMMAEFLQKYPAPANMSVSERLQDAYDWAMSKQPPTIAAHTGALEQPLAQTQAQPKPINPAGQKSVSGAPSGEASKASRKLSRKEAITKAMSQMGL